MSLYDTFRSHSEECQRMADTAQGSQDRESWNQMAQRWLACAEHYQHQEAVVEKVRHKTAASNRPPPKHRYRYW